MEAAALAESVNASVNAPTAASANNLANTIDKPELVAQLLPRVRSAIVERREVIVVDGKPFRHQNGNDKFRDDDTGAMLLAPAGGLYSRMPVSMGQGAAKPRWLHLGAPAEFDRLMRPYLERMPMPALEQLRERVRMRPQAAAPAAPSTVTAQSEPLAQPAAQPAARARLRAV